ncbi:hypothetical protein KP509_27G062100 [Ceratopteris richardii]|uniref:Uncharacterized protein n=1 Tax=Ceratopteris richardii TaxID=49495 RepID=A0A8T2RH40_CERRI|nr:hypothetical protein KP509_27G062100 [Ceratopteris richardii]KAH7295719.1 hypothetical protein KP509_27G062100 [Ceratopteris richardii]
MALFSSRDLCVDVSDFSGMTSICLGEQIEEKLLRPVPHRVAMASISTGEAGAKAFWQPRRSVLPSKLDCDVNLELTEIFRPKEIPVSSAGLTCSTPFFSGSPPCRASNPMVNDVEFSHGVRSKPPPLSATTSRASKRIGQDMVYSFKRPVQSATRSDLAVPRPHVRIEGFDCSARGFDHATCESRRQIPAIA